MRQLLPVLLTLLAVGCADEEHELTTVDGEPNNVVIAGGIAYASLGGAGVARLDLQTGEMLSAIEAVGAAHDLALDGRLLFALDAVAGRLSVIDVSDPMDPAVVEERVEVPAARFVGVDAAGGLVVVSGGTRELTLLSYPESGQLSAPITQLRLGAGQPDVALRSDGQVAFFSTHFEDDVDDAEFGITAMRIGSDGAQETDRIGLEEAGFTPGNASPANFAIESAVLETEVLVAHGGGLAIIDADNPAMLHCRRLLELDFHAVSVAAVGGLAYVVGSDPEPALAIVDIARGELVGSGALSGVPTSVAVDGNNVVVAAGPAGLLVLKR